MFLLGYFRTMCVYGLLMTVGSELLNEIERVSAKRERWLAYSAELHDASLRPAVLLMTQAIERGKVAVQSDDPVEAIAALENLRDFDSDD